MLEEKYRNLQKKEEVRETLSFLRNEIKDEEKLTVLKSIAGEEREIIALLSDEDAKTRKNAALLIGDLQLFHAAEDLLEAYRNETTLFVKSSYLAALGRLNAEDSLDFFKKRFEELVEKEVSEEEKKHVNEELRELNKIITGIEGIKKHTFIGFKKPHEMLLTTNREQREVTLQEVCELSAAVHKKADLHPLGVLVFSKEVMPFTKLRTYRELLFPISVEGKIQKNAQTAAKQLWSSNLYEFLTECHKGSDAFAFRLEVKGSQQQIDFIKKLSSALEQVSGFKFRNSTKEYEIELRLMETKDGGFVPFLKLFTLQMKRFSYRKNAIAMSIHPAAAAMLVHLAKPYLKEGAQVLDPCCGVGTMLIERDICVPAGDMYATDIFGDAIEMG